MRKKKKKKFMNKLITIGLDKKQVQLKLDDRLYKKQVQPSLNYGLDNKLDMGFKNKLISH